MKKVFKSFRQDKSANIQMIGMVIGIFVTLLISVLVLYNILGAMDYSEIDNRLDTSLSDGNTQDAENASVALMSQSETFFTIAPIIGIVIVAVVILSYVGRIGG